MKKCLTERVLLLCAGGDGSDEQLAHLSSCEYCQGRYQRFVHDLEVIERVLGESEPPRVTVTADIDMPWRNRWLPLAAAFAATVVVSWGIWRLQQPVEPDLLANREEQEEAQDETASLLQEDESLLRMVMADQRAVVVPAPVADARYLEAALNDDWPCEWQEETFSPACEFYPISLTFREY